MILHQDCRYFKGEIPCRPHKEHGVHCDGCEYYDKIKFRILIIKLDAPGDVLRTTCILQGLKESHPNSHITWLTMPTAFPFFENNNLVDAILDCSAHSLLQIQSEPYDIVFNPDASPKSAILAALAKGKVKRGFGYNEKGHVYLFNKDAQKWFEMGLFDDIKKANTETYQKIISEMLGIRYSSYDIIFNIDEGEKAFAKSFAEKHGVSKEDLVIGLNTGAGSRWQNKK
jgi:ADP-heptose:LPS heptosyltransferase